MKSRKYQILKRVVEEFINSAKPVSSASFMEMEEFNVSSATIRNEMSRLEKEGMLTHPHTSSGRVPTAKGYKHFVSKLMDISDVQKDKLFDDFQNAKKKYFLAKARERVYDTISILSELTENVAFATIPENKRTIFLGIANFLKQPEFANDQEKASGVIEILEQGFFEKIKDLEFSSEVEIHVGESHIFANVQSCSMMATKYQYQGFEGILGIVGPMRMDYAKNKVLIEYAKMFLEGQKLLTN